MRTREAVPQNTHTHTSRFFNERRVESVSIFAHACDCITSYSCDPGGDLSALIAAGLAPAAGVAAEGREPAATGAPQGVHGLDEHVAEPHPRLRAHHNGRDVLDAPRAAAAAALRHRAARVVVGSGAGGSSKRLAHRLGGGRVLDSGVEARGQLGGGGGEVVLGEGKVDAEHGKPAKSAALEVARHLMGRERGWGEGKRGWGGAGEERREGGG